MTVFPVCVFAPQNRGRSSLCSQMDQKGDVQPMNTAVDTPSMLGGGFFPDGVVPPQAAAAAAASASSAALPPPPSSQKASQPIPAASAAQPPPSPAAAASHHPSQSQQQHQQKIDGTARPCLTPPCSNLCDLCVQMTCRRQIYFRAKPIRRPGSQHSYKHSYLTKTR